MNRLASAFRWFKAIVIDRYQSPAMDPVGWGQEDRAALAAFLRGPTGTRLAALMRRQVFWEAAKAVEAAPAALATRAGYALGFRAMAGLFDTLSEVAPQSDTTDAGPKSGTTAPQSEQGALLRERLRP